MMETDDPFDPRLCADILRSSPDAVIFADRDGLIRLWNEGATVMFGHTAADAIGQSLDLIIPPNLRQRHWDGYHEVMRTGSSRYGRDLLAVPAIRRDGTRISLEFSITLVHGSDGALAGFAAILRDVTERRRRDREIQQRLAALEGKSAPGGRT
jgi:PAS domain S-box-containing protein